MISGGNACFFNNCNKAKFNHFEYSTETLNNEYKRDKKNNLKINIPENYFLDDNPSQKPINCWNENAMIFYNNWLNEIFFHNK